MSLSQRGHGRALAALTAAVLGVHLLLLRAAPGAVELRDPLQVSTLVIRAIEAAPAAPISEGKRPPAPMQPRPVATKPVASSVPARAIPDAAPTPVTEAPPPEPPAPAPVAEPAPVAAPATATASSPSREVAQAPSFAIPGSVRLNYEVTSRTRGIRLDAKAQLTWRHDGSQYDARWEAKGLFLNDRLQRSAGRITAEGLAPTRFSDRGSRSEEAAHFQRDKGLITFSTNRPDAPLAPGAQDRLSVMLQLAAMIAAAPAKYPPSTTITVQTAGTREADPWIFTVEAPEQLELPGGTVLALKLLRAPRKEFDQKVELWLGTGMDYAPVRLRLTSPNEDWVDQLWSGTDRP